MTTWLISLIPLAAGDLLGPRGILIYSVPCVLSISAPWLLEYFDLSYPNFIPLSQLDIVLLRVVGVVGVTAVSIHVAREHDFQVLKLNQQSSQILETHQAAEALNQEKTSFLRKMSRQIRAPLNGIKGMTQVWVRQESDSETREAVGTMDRCANNLLTIISDAQDLSLVDNQQFEIEMHPFSIARVVKDVEDLFKAKAKEKGIELVSSGHSQHPYGIGDEKRITQILSNLIGNAIKFSDQGQVALRWRWLESSSDEPPRIIFEVTDEGIGMSVSQLDSLFMEFTQVHQDESVRRGGTGLGLTISKKLVEAMGGEMVVESALHEGSCFRFEIPMHMASGETDVMKGSLKQSEKLTGMRILLVDDDFASLWVERMALEMMGCEVHSAQNAQEAVALAQHKDFLLAIIDLRMPNIDGIQTLKQLRALECPSSMTPAIALTASAETQDRERCLNGGFEQVLTKPFDFETLHQTISQYKTPVGPMAAVG